MAKRFIIRQTRGARRKVEVIVSDQDAYLLRTHIYQLKFFPTGQVFVHRHIAGEYIGLAIDIFGDGILLHTNGNPLDFRRTNCTVMNRKDSAHLIRLDEKLGNHFNPRNAHV